MSEPFDAELYQATYDPEVDYVPEYAPEYDGSVTYHEAQPAVPLDPPQEADLEYAHEAHPDEPPEGLASIPPTGSNAPTPPPKAA
jgi:hypothetical protein